MVFLFQYALNPFIPQSLINVKERQNIPVFVSCLLRIDSIILVFALYLLVSSSYLSNLSPYAPFTNTVIELGPHLHVSQAVRDTLPTFFIIVALHTLLSFVSAHLLRWIGIHSVSYLCCIVALGALFTGLGRWNAL